MVRTADGYSGPFGAVPGARRGSTRGCSTMAIISTGGRRPRWPRRSRDGSRPWP